VTGSDTALSGLRLIAHPLRLRMLSLLTGATLSAAEIARELGESQPNVSYHLRRLADGGLVRLVDQQKVRGGIAKRYTHDSDSAEGMSRSTTGELGELLSVLAHEMTRRGALYREGSTHAFTDAHVAVSVEDRDLLEAATRDLGRRIHAAATADGDGARVFVSATLMLFETTGDTG